MSHHKIQHGIALPTSLPLPPLQHNSLSSYGLRTLYPNGHPLSLHALSSIDITQLTQHLSPLRPLRSSLPPPLPSTLLNPTHLPQAATINLLHKMGATSALPPASHLCHSHNHLNAQVVSDVLDAIEGEIEDFLPEVLVRIGNDNCSAELPDLEALQKRGGLIAENIDRKSVDKGYPRLSEVAIRYVRAAEDIMALILPADGFTYLYKRQPNSATFPDNNQTTHSRKTKACAACTLRTIATSATALIGLRSILFARLPEDIMQAKKRSPRLEVIEGFMRAFGSEQASWMMAVSGRIGWEMRALVREGQAKSGRMENRGACRPERPQRPTMGLFCGEQLPAPKVRYETKPRVRKSPPPPQPPLVQYYTKPVPMFRGSCIPSPLRIRYRRDERIMVVA